MSSASGVGGRARRHRALLRQPPAGHRDGLRVVQHLSPDFKSMMDELLARHTELPIHLVEDGMPVEADHVYLIPPKNEMIISGGRLLLSEQDRQQELTLPIDVFFRSLAQDCGPRAVADRAVGQRQRRLARHSRRPRGRRSGHGAGRRQRAVRRHAEDRRRRGRGRTGCWRPQDMPRVLARARRSRGADRSPQRRAPARRRRRRASSAVYRMLQEEFGIDFTHYKPSTVTRRIERRLALARSQDIEEYVDVSGQNATSSTCSTGIC